MRIGVDLDGVLSDWNAAFLCRLATVTGRYPEGLPAGRFVPEVWDWPTRQTGYTPDEVRQTWASVHADPYFWQTLDPLPGAVAFLDRLWRWTSLQNWSGGASHEVYFLTKRDGLRVKDQTEHWLAAHGYGGRVPTVCIVRGSKGDVAAACGLDAVVDDHVGNLEIIRAAKGDVDTVLYDAPYNRHATLAPRVATLDALAARWGIR